MAHPHRTYQPRDTEHSVLHAVIREHLEPFLREAAARGDGHGLPRFVEQEFREFLTCGVLAHGFTRLRCAACAFERLLPFSCKRRGFCPSSGGRRMAERAAYLVDEVLPRVPVRQWVLTLPYRLRYRLAWDHALCRAVLGVYARVLLAFYARTARAHGIQAGRTGTVTVMQRFGSGLQLNVHMHTLVLDGVFRETRPGLLIFHAAPLPSDEAVALLLATVRARVGRLLARRHLVPADDPAPPDPLAEVSPVLAGLVGASVQGRVALGPRAGARVRRVELREGVDGRLLVFTDGACVAAQPAPADFALRPRRSPSSDRRRTSQSHGAEGARYPPTSPTRPSPPRTRSASAARTPSPTHPWRHSTPYSTPHRGMTFSRNS